MTLAEMPPVVRFFIIGFALIPNRVPPTLPEPELAR